MTQKRTCDVVLEACVRPQRRVAVLAGAGALLLHIGGAAAALALSHGPETPTRKPSKPMVVIDHVVDLTPPEPPKVEEPPPPPPPPPPPSAPKPKLKPPPAPKEKVAPTPVAEPEPPPTPPPPSAPEPEKPPSEPPPAAQAAQVVAADAPGAGAFAIATGSGNAYTGGTTTASGTGKTANHTGQIGQGNGNGYSKARPPQVSSRNWPCGWPPEAEDLDLEEAFVTVRAVVKANGDLGDVQVLQDPGYGFGKRAVWCARAKVRFDPALDPAGNPTEGVTPPLRVRFVRDDDY